MAHSSIQRRPEIPYRLLIVILLIAALGVTNVYSAAHSWAPRLWITQCGWIGVGLLVAFTGLLFDYRAIERVAYPLYIFTVGLLVLVLVHGKKVLGAQRWINLGVASFQPSEIMKISIVFVLAKYFAEERRDAGYTIRDLIRPLNMSRPVIFLAGLVIAWKKNVWLQDPIGELARHLYGSTNGVLPEWDGSYLFRTLLATAIVFYLMLGAYLYSAHHEEVKLYDEGAAFRRRIRLGLWLGPPFVASLLCYVFWQSEFLGDPKSTIVAWLVNEGGPQGFYENFHPVLWFRLVLLLGLLTYLGAAIWVQVKKGVWDLASFVAPIDLVLLPMALIMKQPDLGTALLVGSISFSLILFIGMRLVSIVLLGSSGAGLAIVAWYALLKGYQKQRLLTFLDPDADALGTGYHANQSMMAVGSGQMFGKGFALGTQTQLSFLPEPHTDFAFSVWSEEHGFVGCLILIALYFALVVFAVSVAASARDKFGALLVTGFTALIFWQAFVNMGMVTNLLPIVGVPLPLFSYGGSSILSVMIGMGITFNVAYRRYSF